MASKVAIAFGIVAAFVAAGFFLSWWLTRKNKGPKAVIPFFKAALPRDNPPKAGCFTANDPKYSKPLRPPPHEDWEVLRRRNHAIVATIFEIGSCFVGFALAGVRKSIITNLLNACLLVCSLIGFWGSLKIWQWWCFFHALLVFGISSVFFLFMFLEAFYFDPDEAATIVLLHLAFIADFFVCIFTFRLYNLLKFRRKVALGEYRYTEQQEKQFVIEKDYYDNKKGAGYGGGGPGYGAPGGGGGGSSVALSPIAAVKRKLKPDRERKEGEGEGDQRCYMCRAAQKGHRFAVCIHKGQFQTPAYWLPDDGDPAKARRMELAIDSPQFKAVASQFRKGCPGKGILRIEFIQCVNRWAAYNFKKQQFSETIGGIDKVNERSLWHGTHPSNVEKIAHQGFLRQFANRAAYGDGIYFAKDPSYSVHPTYATPDEQGRQTLFLTRVLLGEFHVGRAGLKLPDEKPGKQHVVYESVANSTVNPSVFVIFQDDQAYPEFVVTCR